MLARPNKRVNWRRRHFWRAPGSTNHRGLPTTNAEQKRWTLASRDGFFGVNLASAAEKRRPLFLPISNTFSSGIRLEEAAALFCRCGGEVVRDCCRPDMLCMHIRLGEDRHGDPSDRGAWKPGGSTFVSAGSCHYRRRRKRWRKSTSREPWGGGVSCVGTVAANKTVWANVCFPFGLMPAAPLWCPLRLLSLARASHSDSVFVDLLKRTTIFFGMFSNVLRPSPLELCSLWPHFGEMRLNLADVSSLMWHSLNGGWTGASL